MTLPLLRLVAASTDADDFHTRLIQARDAEVEARCPHGLDVDDCGACWIEDDVRYERSQDR